MMSTDHGKAAEHLLEVAERAVRLQDPTANVMALRAIGHALLAPYSTGMRQVELVMWRDDDGQPEYRVYVDGEPYRLGQSAGTVVIVDLDPGRGWVKADWDESVTEQTAELSDVARHFARQLARDIAENSQWVGE